MPFLLTCLAEKIASPYRCRILALVAVLATSGNSQTYDLLLKGGHVIDPGNRVDAARDVAIESGLVVAIDEDIPADRADTVIDVSGLYVTPGLVDIHAHFYVTPQAGTVYEGSSSVDPDTTCPRTCVTTAVDVGTVGWRAFPDFRKRIIEKSRKTRVLAMLNIVGMGMVNYDVEQNLADMQPEATADMATRNADVVVGIKSAHWRQPNFESVDRAVEAAELAGVPVMVDFGYFLPDRPYQTMVLDRLRSGDMSTHFYRWPAPLLDENGQKLPYLDVARRRGVKFDVGHGAGSFHFRLAEPLVRQGFWPDSISTDLHINSHNGAMIDMVTVMSKFLAMGMPLAEVVLRSTANPAGQILRQELGQIAVGAEADIAVLRVDSGEFGYVDVLGGRITGDRRIGCEMTLRAGEIVFDYNGRAGTPWRDADVDYPGR